MGKPEPTAAEMVRDRAKWLEANVLPQQAGVVPNPEVWCSWQQRSGQVVCLGAGLLVAWSFCWKAHAAASVCLQQECCQRQWPSRCSSNVPQLSVSSAALLHQAGSRPAAGTRVADNQLDAGSTSRLAAFSLSGLDCKPSLWRMSAYSFGLDASPFSGKQQIPTNELCHLRGHSVSELQAMVCHQVCSEHRLQCKG